ncbi:hypothetical protein, partial [Escherichia coli]|uniref:hypothetical protein n=1 Tax=Escherichia coli TaxID=562 RepID=UPI001F48B30B
MAFVLTGLQYGRYRLHNEWFLEEVLSGIAPSGNPTVTIGDVTLDSLEEVPVVGCLLSLYEDVTSGTPQ